MPVGSVWLAEVGAAAAVGAVDAAAGVPPNDGSADGVGVAIGSVAIGVGGDVAGGAVGTGVGAGVGGGVGVGQPDMSLRPASADAQSDKAPATGVKALGLGRLLTNGTAIAAPVAVPKTWFIPCSAWLALVWPAHVATTQSGVYAMYQASTKLSVVPDLPAVGYLNCRFHCLG
jgi:hypothetical protein